MDRQDSGVIARRLSLIGRLMLRIVITDMMTHSRRSSVVRHIIIRCVDVVRVSESRRTRALHCTLADGERCIPPHWPSSWLINVTGGN